MSVFRGIARVFRIVWTGVDGFRKVLHLFLLVFLFAVIGGIMAPPPAVVPASGALVIAPVGSLVEEYEGEPFDRALAELVDDAPDQTLVRDVVDALRFARDDDRITAVVLELDGLGGGGMAKLERLADALKDFRSSGKTVIANANFYSQAAYYLASGADEVYMHPDGMFLPQGFSLYSNYFSEALAKLEVDWNVFKVGTHKSAVEPFTRMDMSPADRESRANLAEQLWATMQRGVVEGRGLEPNALDDFAENLLVHQETYEGDLAMAAAELGFIDGLMTGEQLRSRIAEVVGEDDDSDRGYKAAGMRGYLRQMRMIDGPAGGENQVAVIVASGEVLNGSQPPGLIGGESTSALLRQARLDDSIKAVVIRVDTPGGSSFAAEQIRNEIEALRAAGKPVVASMSSIAASAGYWISMAADEILARESTITGSIGVFLMFPTVQRSLESVGIGTDGVGTTRWAGQFRLDRELSDDARDFLQNFINKGYDDFISMVAVYRDLEKDAVDAVAQGQVWTGTDALEHGLIDSVGDLDAAVARAAELAELDDYQMDYLERDLDSTEQMILELIGGVIGLGIDLPDFTSGNRSELAMRLLSLADDALTPILRFDDPRGMYSYCFCSVH